jgi:hypothetical protein
MEVRRVQLFHRRCPSLSTVAESVTDAKRQDKLINVKERRALPAFVHSLTIGRPDETDFGCSLLATRKLVRS